MSLARRVYVGAAHEDAAWCRAFVEALRWSGADVLYAEYGALPAPPGQPSSRLTDEIEPALLARPHFVAVLSPAAVLSPPMQQAVQAALRLQRQESERITLAVVAAGAALPAAWSPAERIGGADGSGLPPAEAAARVRDRLAGIAPRQPASSMPLSVAPAQEARARDAWEQGKVLCAQGRMQEALVVYDQALASDPTLAPIWYSKGTLLAALERGDEALVALDRALACDASLTIAWHAKGRVHLAAQAPYPALQAFEHALRVNPGHTPSWVGRGDAYTQLRRYADALEAYEHALERDASDAEVWHRKGNMLRMLQRHPESPPAHSRPRTLGAPPAHEDRDWDGEALDAYEHALDLDPKHALAWANTIDLLEELGRHRAARSARRARDKALAVDVSDEETRYTPHLDGA